eukprot:g10218.t1
MLRKALSAKLFKSRNRRIAKRRNNKHTMRSPIEALEDRNVSAWASLDAGLRGHFDVDPGNVSVNYMTDMNVRAHSPAGGDFNELTAGEQFFVRTSDTPDRNAIRMETRFASIDAGLSLDYHARGGLTTYARLFDGAEVNTNSVDVEGSIELIGANADLGTGSLSLELLGQDVNLPNSLEYSDPLGLATAKLQIPALNTGVANDGNDDSHWNANQRKITNTTFSNSGGLRADAEFFSLGVNLDEIVSYVSGVPLGISLDAGVLANVDVSLIDAAVTGRLSVGQTTTFEPTQMVDLNFRDQFGKPLAVQVETNPGSGVFQTTTSHRMEAGKDLKVLHPGVDLTIDTDYVLSGTFSNNTELYFTPTIDLALISGNISSDLGSAIIDVINTVDPNAELPPLDYSFEAFSGSYPLSDPVPIANLFDGSFDLKGFREVDGGDLLIEGDNDAPVVSASGRTISAPEGNWVSRTGTFSDSDLADIVHLKSSIGRIDYDPANSGSWRWTYQTRDSDDSQTVTVTATDSRGATSSTKFPLRVFNRAPRISSIYSYANYDTPARAGKAAWITAYVTDSGAGDTHRATIDWGDGTTDRNVSVSSTGRVSRGHHYAKAGDYTVTVKVTDDDGGTTYRSTTAVASGVAVHDGVLQIVGTSDKDVVMVDKTGPYITVQTSQPSQPGSNQSHMFYAHTVDSIEVYTGNGDDSVAVSQIVPQRVLANGGNGNDVLIGGSGNNILIGGSGEDVLIGGNNRDLLIGGDGADVILSQGGEDIVIGGWTTHDNNADALNRVMDEWADNSKSKYRRTTNLKYGYGRNLNGTRLSPGSTVADDDDVDRVYGDNLDLLFVEVGDILDLGL